MKKNILTLIISTGVTLGLIISALHQAPCYLMGKSTDICIQGAGGVNQFYFQQLADHTFDSFPSPCPNLLYSNLVFDVGKSALLVEFPAYNDFWINQMVCDNTDTFAYVGYETKKNQPVKMILFSHNSPSFDIPDDAIRIEAPSDTGMFLVRYLVRDKTDLPGIDSLRRSVKLVELKSE
jgi:uncharacterized membrane protein